MAQKMKIIVANHQPLFLLDFRSAFRKSLGIRVVGQAKNQKELFAITKNMQSPSFNYRYPNARVYCRVSFDTNKKADFPTIKIIILEINSTLFSYSAHILPFILPLTLQKK